MNSKAKKDLTKKKKKMPHLPITAHKTQIFADYPDHLAAGKWTSLTKVELSVCMRE